jgi:hypothetical protein
LIFKMKAFSYQHSAFSKNKTYIDSRKVLY